MVVRAIEETDRDGVSLWLGERFKIRGQEDLTDNSIVEVVKRSWILDGF